MNRPYCIDIYQGDNVQDYPDAPLGGFEKVKAYGIAFCIHKATEGTSFVDGRYAARRNKWMSGQPIRVTDVDGTVLALQPRWGAYHFFHGSDPYNEAKFFLKTADLQPGDCAVLDWENVGASGFAPSANVANTFCSVVEHTLGYPIVIYGGNVPKEQLHGVDTRFVKRPLWLASYSSTYTVQDTWKAVGPWLWQNDGDRYGPGPHTIPGMDGLCDNSTVTGNNMTVKKLYNSWGDGKTTV